jgi:DNA repair protein RadA/Sms
MTEIAVRKPVGAQKGYAGGSSECQKLSEIVASDLPRIPTGCPELDRVLGGGLVPGAVTLVGGDPGVGKSTLLLQSASQLSQQGAVLYVSGEESPKQIAMRAQRLGVLEANCQVLAETEVESIIASAQAIKPTVMIIDSIQTMHLRDIPSASGSVSQVRESAAALARYAKEKQVAIFLVGHVTKTGEVAGPRVLEHIVDTVVFMEGQEDSRYRLLRSVKNRFGSVNELGVFGMTEQGLKAIKNPSAIFLSKPHGEVSGSAVTVLWEGTRPLLIEIQALVDDSHSPQPRRVTVGLDHNRLAMLLAVLNRHGGIFTSDQDVFVNVVSGVRITETSADLAVLLAVVSSLKNKPVPQDVLIFGEVGLSGEIRPVPSGQERIREAVKHGFNHAIVPFGNAPKGTLKGVKITSAKTLSEAIEALF